MKTDSNCLLQMFALSKVSVFNIPFSLSEVIPNASFLRDLTNDQNFFTFSVFLGQSGSGLSVSKENILEICFQYASLMVFSTNPTTWQENGYALFKELVDRTKKAFFQCIYVDQLIFLRPIDLQ